MDGKRKGKKSHKPEEKKVVGLVEKIKIIGSRGEVETDALLDTGATRSSVDIKLAAEAGLGPVIGIKKVKSQTESTGHLTRAVVRGEMSIRGMRKKVKFTLSDRSEMAYPVLVGRDVIHSDFVVDVEKTHASHKISDLKEKK